MVDMGVNVDGRIGPQPVATTQSEIAILLIDGEGDTPSVGTGSGCRRDIDIGN